MRSIADEIKRARKALDLNQKELGDALGASQGSVSKWERGLETPRAEMFFKIQELYEIAETNRDGGVRAGRPTAGPNLGVVTMTTAGRDAYTHTIRFPNMELVNRLKEAAKLNGRSLNSEVIFRLESSLETSRQIAPAFAELLEQHIQQEVKNRLNAIVEKLGQ